MVVFVNCCGGGVVWEGGERGKGNPPATTAQPPAKRRRAQGLMTRPAGQATRPGECAQDLPHDHGHGEVTPWQGSSLPDVFVWTLEGEPLQSSPRLLEHLSPHLPTSRPTRTLDGHDRDKKSHPKQNQFIAWGCDAGVLRPMAYFEVNRYFVIFSSSVARKY